MAKKTNYVKNGYEYYRTSLTIGRDESGKIIKKEFYGLGIKDAEDQKKEYLRLHENGINADLNKQLLGTAMKIWLQTEPMKESTHERYDTVYRNYIEKSELAILQICKINNLTLKKHYLSLREAGKTDNQIINLNKLLSRFFNYCLDENAIYRNPCSRIKLKQEKGVEVGTENSNQINHSDEIPTFKSEEIAKILKAVETNRLKPLIYLALGSGAREGELLALTWNDINLEENQISINKTLSKVRINKEYKFIITTPKTKKSIRTIPIPENVMNILYEWKLKQVTEKLKAAECYADNNLVFPTENGTPIDRRNLLRSHERILTNAGVEYKKFHAYRHTYATQLFELGVSIKTVSTLLGHGSIKITADTYITVLDKSKTSAVAMINKLFA